MVELNKLLLLGSITLATAVVEGYAYADKYLHMVVDRMPGSNNLVKREDDEINLPLDYHGHMYIAEVEIGSNDQKVYVQVDTGSSDFWVIGSDNIHCKQGTAGSLSRRDEDEDSEYVDCATYGTFNSSSSSSFTSNDTEFYIKYNDGTHANGTWGQDTLTIGGVSIKNMNLAVANDTTKTWGLLGIGLATCESTSVYDKHKYANLPIKLVEEGLIEKMAYSMYPNGNHSELLFGAVDTAKYDGTLVQFPIVNSGFLYGIDEPYDLAITLNELSFYNNQTNSTDLIFSGVVPAVLDTGTATSSFPWDIFELIVNILGYTYDSSYNLYKGDCLVGEDMIIKFNFQDYIVDLPLSNFLRGIEVDNVTYFCVFDSERGDNSSVILGDLFLNQMYMVADLEDLTIALAKAVDTDDSSIEVIQSSIPNASSASGTNTYASTNSKYILNSSVTTISPVTNTRASKNGASTENFNVLGLVFVLFAFI